jgi:hypothetical protein
MNQKLLAIGAIVLIIVAGLLFARQTLWNPDNRAKSGPSVEQMIKDIEANPRMPPQAKQMAIQQLKMRMSSEAQGALAKDK